MQVCSVSPYRGPYYAVSTFLSPGVYTCNSLFLESFLYSLPLTFTWKIPIHPSDVCFEYLSSWMPSLCPSVSGQRPLFSLITFAYLCSSCLYPDQERHEVGILVDWAFQMFWAFNLKNCSFALEKKKTKTFILW